LVAAYKLKSLNKPYIWGIKRYIHKLHYFGNY